MNTRKSPRLILAVAVSTVLLGACGGADMRKTGSMETVKTAEELAAWESELSRQNREVDMRMQQAMAMEKSAMAARDKPMMDPARSDAALLPPNAQAGECYARVFVPPKYQTVTNKVLKHEAKEQIKILPARFETVTERVLVEEASEKLELIPARYAWREEKQLVKPETQRLVEVPATYERVSEQVLVKPAHTVWQKGTGPIQKIDEATGEIMCLVEVPATYRTVSKMTLKTPARTETVTEPAVYKTIKKRVMVSPPTTRTVQIPAKYKTVAVTRLVEAPREVRETIPAVYQTVSKQELVSDGRMEWRSILCKTNMTAGRISLIQQALERAGYNPGPIDGIVGPETMRAVNAYQRDNNLPVDKYLNVKTVKALGVKPI